MSIENDIKQSLLYPGALIIPHGRAFIAHNFGMAFLYTSHKVHETTSVSSSIRFDGLSPIVQNHWKLRGTISACRLNQTNVKNIEPNIHISNISAISFYGRLAGPEIVVANITRFQTGNHEFRWTVSFPPVSETGIYELFIMTDWIFGGRYHSIKLPFHQSRIFRVNEGLILHIGGLGGYSSYVRDESWKKYNFDGLIIGLIDTTKDNYQNVYLIHNNTRYSFQSIHHFYKMKYNNSDIIFLREEFVRHRFPVIKELPMSKTFQKSKQIIISKEFKKVLQNLAQDRYFFYGDIPWEQSLVYHRRWVREPLCDRYTQSYATNEKMRESNNGNGNNGIWPAPGSECSHSVSQLTNRFRNRSSSMVWRPYTCQLAHYSTCQHNNINNNRCSDKRHPQSYLSAQDCLKARNILFIAGFGDSLGSEQLEAYHDIGAALQLAKCIKDTLQIELQQRKHYVFERKTKEPLTIVLATNFAVQHALEFSMSTSIRLLERQVEVHNQLAQELLHDYNIVYRRIFMTGIRTHGFHYPWLSPQRMEMLNRHASDILGRAGWEIFDAYAMTLGRPDGVVDSVHYRGGFIIVVFFVRCYKRSCADGPQVYFPAVMLIVYRNFVANTTIFKPAKFIQVKMFVNLMSYVVCILIYATAFSQNIRYYPKSAQIAPLVREANPPLWDGSRKLLRNRDSIYADVCIKIQLLGKKKINQFVIQSICFLFFITISQALS
eukprot:gene5932-11968_t